MLINLLLHDLPQTVVVYFYYARYKPPSLDLRMENMIQPIIDICVVFILVIIQIRNVLKYKELFGTKVVRLLVWFTAVPIVIVTPILKVSIVLSSVFSQLATYTSDGYYDPKKHKLLETNGSAISVEKIDNEYSTMVNGFLEQSLIKDWFRPRHQQCVSTSVMIRNGEIEQSIVPIPFAKDCMNVLEWCMIATVPFILFGLLSFIFLLRKVWYKYIL